MENLFSMQNGTKFIIGESIEPKYAVEQIVDYLLKLELQNKDKYQEGINNLKRCLEADTELRKYLAFTLEHAHINQEDLRTVLHRHSIEF
jgi:hypothetical protein